MNKIPAWMRIDSSFQCRLKAKCACTLPGPRLAQITLPVQCHALAFPPALSRRQPFHRGSSPGVLLGMVYAPRAQMFKTVVTSYCDCWALEVQTVQTQYALVQNTYRN